MTTRKYTRYYALVALELASVFIGFFILARGSRWGFALILLAFVLLVLAWDELRNVRFRRAMKKAPITSVEEGRNRA